MAGMSFFRTKSPVAPNSIKASARVSTCSSIRDRLGCIATVFITGFLPRCFRFFRIAQSCFFGGCVTTFPGWCVAVDHYFVEQAGVNVEDEAADGVVVEEKRGVTDTAK